MSRRLILGALVLHVCAVFVQAELQWAWISGTNSTTWVSPNWVDKGVPSSVAHPGSRESHAGWFDPDRREYWLYGGNILYQNSYVSASDLWKYSLADNKWTWIGGTAAEVANFGTKGVAAASNWPGARNAHMTAIDTASRTLWLFAGRGLVSTGSDMMMNDLWKYSIADQQWTWVSGDNYYNQNPVFPDKGVPSSTLFPPIRQRGCIWLDTVQQELWIFGGGGVIAQVAGYLSDVWKYKIADNTWMFVNGTTTLNDVTVGEWSVASPDNNPGGRSGQVCWFNPTTRRTYMFGGSGYAYTWNDTVTALYRLNDFWWFDMNTNTWLFHDGDKSYENNWGSFLGTLGVESADPYPGPRTASVGWANWKKNELWLIGGYCNAAYNSNSEIWRVNLNNFMWTWMGGSSSINQVRSFGTKSVPSASNYPGALEYGVAFFDTQTDQFWLHAGQDDNTREPFDSMMVGFETTPGTSCIDWASGGSLIKPSMCASNYCAAGLCQPAPPSVPPPPSSAPVAAAAPTSSGAVAPSKTDAVPTGSSASRLGSSFAIITASALFLLAFLSL
eukprot:TRINITY_DN11786_c0_g1_i1.p1 TRINITY_DN11786_c0_g1~~TRINITY_DN11786_c0_g1_i1.p1  ORF type:complete len:558 (+),score=66.75 TRINITY_DN11786_c0_g1_i1:27-1700(+)